MTDDNIICLEERRQAAQKFSVRLTASQHAKPTAMGLHGHLVDIMLEAAELDRSVIIDGMHRDEHGHTYLDVVSFRRD